MAAGFLEALYQVADLLGAAAVGDQQRVRGIDDDQILTPSSATSLFSAST